MKKEELEEGNDRSERNEGREKRGRERRGRCGEGREGNRRGRLVRTEEYNMRYNNI